MIVNKKIKKILYIAICIVQINTTIQAMMTIGSRVAQNSVQVATPALAVAVPQLLNNLSSSPLFNRNHNTDINANYKPQVKNYTHQQKPQYPAATSHQFKPTHIQQQRSFSTAITNFDEADWDAPRTHEEIIKFLDIQFAGQFDANANIAKIAWPMQGYSYQKIMHIMHEAQNSSSTQTINMNSFYAAINNDVNGPKKPTTISLPNNKGVMVKTPDKVVAYHEAGHAVAELYNSTGYIVSMATAENYRVLEGFITRISGHAQQPIPKHIINTMIMRLAGIVTEQVFGIGYDTKMLTDPDEILTFLSAEHAHGDIEKFMESSIKILKQQNNLTQQQVRNLTVQVYQITYQFIASHKPEIQQLAESMMKKGTIYEDEIYSLPGAYKPLYKFEHGPLPEKLADQYIYRGQPNPYGYDAQGNYVGEEGYRDKDGNLQEID
jgi:hypothetical protein